MEDEKKGRMEVGPGLSGFSGLDQDKREVGKREGWKRRREEGWRGEVGGVEGWKRRRWEGWKWERGKVGRGEEGKVGRMEGLSPIMSESLMTRIARKCIKKAKMENQKNQKGRKSNRQIPKRIPAS